MRLEQTDRRTPRWLARLCACLVFITAAWGQSGLTKTLREADLGPGQHVNGYYNKTDRQYSNGGLQVQLAGLTASASHQVEFSKDSGSTWSGANRLWFKGGLVTNAIISTDVAENAVDFDIYHSQLTATPYNMSNGETIQIRVVNDVFAAKDTFVCTITGGGNNLIYDITPPTISSVSSSTGDGTYGINANINVTVTFSEPTTLSNGSLRVTLNTNQNVDIAAGTYSNTASGSYPVQEGDLVGDLNNTSVSITGISLTDDAGNEVEIYEPGSYLGSTSDIVIDGVRPKITSVTSTPTSGTYGIGSGIDIIVTFSEPTTVLGGNLRVWLDAGQFIDIAGATYSNTATGTYTVQVGDYSTDMNTDSIAITAGTIRDAADNDLTDFIPQSNLTITSNLFIDGIRPTITGVTSTAADPIYGIGDNIPIRVDFSEFVSLSGGNLEVELETGTPDQIVTIVPFSSAEFATGTYTVQEGDINAVLTENSVSETVLNILTDVAGNAMTDFTVPALNHLGDNKNIEIDGVRPTISNVTSLASPSGTFIIDDNLTIQVNFDELVSLVGGNLQVTLETGATDTTISTSSVINTTSATATYTVLEGHTSSDLSANTVGVSAGTLEDAAGNAMNDFSIPPGQNISDLNGASSRVIDGIRPTISSVTTSVGNGTYIIGQTIPITVTFDQAVTTSGGGDLVVTLETGATDQEVVISGVVSSITAASDYVVQEGDITPLLDVNSIAMNAGFLVSDNGNAVTDFSIPVNLSASKSIVIDGIKPGVTNVTALNTNGAYNADSTIKVIVTFDDVVSVGGTGSPQLKLAVAGGYLVSLSGGSGTQTLQFDYVPVSPNHNEPDLDYFDANALILGTATIQDANGNDADIQLFAPGDPGSLGYNKAIIIDTEAPTVLNVTSLKTDGYYKAGVTIPIAVVFSEAVTVGGTPQLTLDVNGGYAVDYSSSSSGDTLFFDYIVQPGDSSADLAYISTGALGVSGTIKDAASNSANRALATPGDAKSLSDNKALVIDTTVPMVSSVSSTAPDGYYVKDDVIPITVTFSEVVNVAGTGTPTLTLETGDTDTQVSYVSGSGTENLLFNYIVAEGHESDNLDYTATEPLQLNLATIKDSADNDADPTLAAPGAIGSLGYLKDRNIDAIIPTVTLVTSTTADGAYKADKIIPIAVVFSENVGVLGTPTLTLDVGGGYDVDYANRTSGDTLFFDYTVLPGHNKTDLGYVSTTALKLNGGSIQDAATNPADTLLPTPTNPASLSGAKNLDIDTTPPAFNSVAPADSSYQNSTKVSYTLSEDIASGSITWSRTGGAADPAPHNQALTGTELATGAHSDITLTYDPPLVSGTVYSITFAGLDAAGNAATNIVRTGVTFDDTPPQAALTYSDTLASQGDTVTITLTVDEAAAASPRIQITYSPSVIPPVPAEMDVGADPTVWCYDAIMPAANDGLATVSITATDLAGNALTAGNTIGRTRLLVDNTPPGYVLSYSDSLVKEGDLVTITATIEESVQPTPTISIIFAGSGPNITDMTMNMASSDSIWTYIVQTPAGNDGFATVTVTALDLAGNAVTPISGSTNTLKVDNTPPTITPSSPVDSGFVRTTAVTYALGETVASGQVIWTWEENPGVTDNDSPHPQALAGSELTSPGYSGILTNAPTLVQAAAYTLQFIAVDYAGNADTVDVSTVTYDTLAPLITAAYVYDGPPDTTDIDSTQSTDTLTAHWGGFSEPVSGIALYEYAIGTMRDSSDVVDWTSNSKDTLVTVKGLQLTHKRRYYFSVRATDGAGNVSDTVSSNGVRIVDKPRLTANVVQNSVIPEYVQIFVNDTLGMADSIRIVMDSLRVSVTEIDTFAYVGTHKLAGSGPHSLELTGFSAWGDTTRTSSLAMTLAKQGQPWVAASVDQRFKTAGFPGSVSGDRYLLVVDSTLMGLSAVRGGAYRLGDGQLSFNQPVRVSMRPGMNKNGREEAQAIYILRSNGRWEELPSVDEGELVTTWANSTGTFRLGRRTVIVPQTTRLHQNYPNPFNPTTRIVFDLGFQEGPLQHARVVIYNLLGQEVLTLYDGEAPAGRYELTWQGVDARGITVASGIYFVHLTTDSGRQMTRKMLLVR